MTTKTDRPRVWIACLAAYNAGKLHGEWVEVPSSADELHEEIARILAASPEPDAEEWSIHDHEGFYGIEVSENPDLDELCRLADMIEEHGQAYAAYCDMVGADYATPDGFEEAYQGEWDSEQEFAENFIDDMGILSDAPEVCQMYFDYEKYARDLFIDSYYFSNGYVFARS